MPYEMIKLAKKEAAEIELINLSYPLEELDQRVDELAKKLTRIPLTQLTAMKLIVNQTYDNTGLNGTRVLGHILDGAMRNTPECREFVQIAMFDGVKAVVEKRDGPFNGYSQGPPEDQPRKKKRAELIDLMQQLAGRRF